MRCFLFLYVLDSTSISSITTFVLSLSHKAPNGLSNILRLVSCAACASHYHVIKMLTNELSKLLQASHMQNIKAELCAVLVLLPLATYKKGQKYSR